jgi:nucleoside-diphosphate-sugar epimerase
MTTVLVTGGAGNLGQQVASKLARRGHKVRLFDLPALDYSFAGTEPNMEVNKGDIRKKADLKKVCEDIEWAVHLAAVMPPLSEADNPLARSVNIEGTRNLLQALNPDVPIIFASSAAIYGVPEVEVVQIDHPQKPIDFYGETKLQNERDIIDSGRPFMVLRISGISVPALLEIPRPWFFKADQRLEFVHLEDAAEAIVNCVGNDALMGRIFQISGGKTWQMIGADYAHAICEAFDTPFEICTYLEQPGWTGWYDTKDSQELLQYQNHTFSDFIERLGLLYREAIG